MPRYNFLCDFCPDIIELNYSIHDDTPTECPTCVGGVLKKIYTVPGVSFKGPGFSSNDSKGAFRRSNGQGY